MRLVFVPDRDFDNDIRDMGHFAGAVSALGHQGHTFTYRDIKKYAAYDVVLEANRSRPEGLPVHIRHIAWIQDYFPGDAPDYDGNALPGDIVYTRGDGPLMGRKWAHWRGSLVNGVHQSLLEYPPCPTTIDISFAGYIPVQQDVDIPYKPLTGSFTWGEMAALHPGISSLKMIESARFADRYNAAKLALLVSGKCKFVGIGWTNHFPDHAQQHLLSWGELLDVYQRSKINLHTNVQGLGLHSRVLEAMAVGGFVMANETPFHTKAGRLGECFEPGVHYGEYNAETLVDQARYWLGNEDHRKKAAAEARKVVKDKHLWSHRAAQVLKDLQ